METNQFASMLWLIWLLASAGGGARVLTVARRRREEQDEGSIESIEAALGELIGHRHL